MNNKILINIIFFLLILGLFGIYHFKDLLINNNGVMSAGSITPLMIDEDIFKLENENIVINDKDKAEIKKQKIDGLRKKLALKGLILKGDINLDNGDFTSALVKYIQIHKEIPNDESIIKKLGDVYFNLKKYNKAYSYYSKIKNYDKLDKNRVILTLMSSKSLDEKNIKYINDELKTLKLSKEEYFYYINSLICTTDFSTCRKNFYDYFEKKNEKLIIEGTGSIEKVTKFEDLDKIEKALDNYDNFKIDDLSYKGALIAGVYFENGLYPIAISTSKQILSEKKDYKPLLKIVAKSYYELGNYIEAKIYLIKYNKLVKNDHEVSYFLGVVYEKLHEYVLSNIHLKKALKIGYEDTLDVNKRILFNYYELGEMNKMLDIFKVIIQEHSDLLISDDYNLAIYYNIVNDKLLEAKDYTKSALEKYPESETFNGYMGWILMEQINKKPVIENIETSTGTTLGDNGEVIEKINLYAEAEKYINKGLELNTKSPMINLVKGKLEVSKGNIKKSFIYFKKTVVLDNNGDFGKMAQLELKNINMDIK